MQRRPGRCPRHHHPVRLVVLQREHPFVTETSVDPVPHIGQFDHLNREPLHRRRGRAPAEPQRGRNGHLPRPQRAQPGRLNRRQHPGRHHVGQLVGDDSLFAAPGVDRQDDRQRKNRHHPQDIDAQVGLGAQQRRAVPQPVHDDGAEVAQQHAPQPGRQAALLQGEVHPDPGHRGEQRMGERPDHQPHARDGQRAGQRLGAGDVEDVLQPGESGRSETGVHQAVGQRVEFDAAPAGQHQQQEQALGRLLDHRGADGHRGETDLLLAGAEGLVDHVFQRHRQQHGHRRTPEEGHDQQPRRFRFPAIQPQVARQHAGQRHRGQREAQGGAGRVDGGQQAQDQSGERAERENGCQGGADLADRAGIRRHCGIGRQHGSVGHQSRVAAGTPGFVQVAPCRVGSAGTRVHHCGHIARDPNRNVPTTDPVRSNPTICPVPPSPRRK